MLEGADVAGGGRRHLALMTTPREREMGCVGAGGSAKGLSWLPEEWGKKGSRLPQSLRNLQAGAQDPPQPLTASTPQAPGQALHGE